MEGQQEFTRRLTQARQAMRDQGLDALLVHDNGRHNFLRMNYVAYLTDFIGVGPEAMVVLPREDDPALYLSPTWDIPRAREESWIGDVRPFAEVWPRLSSLTGKVGLAGREAMSAALHDEIVKFLGRPPVNAKEIIENMARSKSEFELERLRRAAAIADAGVSALHEEARIGLKEYELAAIVEYRMRSLGAEDNFGMVVANSHNQALHPPTDRVTRAGDIIIGEITPCVGGLFVQICRTMVLGEPAPVVREKYAILKKAMGLGMEAARTGAPASAVAAAINDTFHACALPRPGLRFVRARKFGGRQSDPTRRGDDLHHSPEPVFAGDRLFDSRRYGGDDEDESRVADEVVVGPVY